MKSLAPLAELGWRVVGMDPEVENLAEAGKIAELSAGRIALVAGGFAELDGEPFGDWIGDRLAGLRDAWSQTTFFLTDPNSWR